MLSESQEKVATLLILDDEISPREPEAEGPRYFYPMFLAPTEWGRILESIFDVSVLTFAIEDPTEVLQGRKPDLVLVDLYFPIDGEGRIGPTGFRSLEALLELEREIAIAVWSGTREPSDRVRVGSLLVPFFHKRLLSRPDGLGRLLMFLQEVLDEHTKGLDDYTRALSEGVFSVLAGRGMDDEEFIETLIELAGITDGKEKEETSRLLRWVLSKVADPYTLVRDFTWEQAMPLLKAVFALQVLADLRVRSGKRSWKSELAKRITGQRDPKKALNIYKTWLTKTLEEIESLRRDQDLSRTGGANGENPVSIERDGGPIQFRRSGARNKSKRR